MTRFLSPLFVLLLAIVFAAGTPDAGRAQNAPEERARAIIQSMADQVLASLRDESQTTADREALYGELFTEHFNIPVIGRWVLGRSWRDADEAQREEYIEVFRRYIVKTYAIQFTGFTGEQFEITGAEAEDDGAVVLSEIRSPDGVDITQVRWRFRPAEDGTLKINDVVIENISMALTQRREFASIIERRGGTVDGLIGALREKIAELEQRADGTD